MTVRNDFLGELGRRHDGVLALCRDLIRIPSEDPPGDTRAMHSYLSDYLSQRGIAATLHAREAKRPNLVAPIPLGQPGPSIVFSGHIETLPVGDEASWTHAPFAADVAGGKVFGRGAQCMKGGIAALVSAALALRDRAADLPGTVVLALVSDEVNGGGAGTGYLIDTVPDVRGHVALVGEGSSGINFVHKGPVFLEFTVRGDSGHGAYTYASQSAIHRMIDFLADLRQLDGLRCSVPPDVLARIEASRGFTDEAHGVGATDALLRLTVNVGVVKGGRKVNVIADDCAAQVDLRLPPGMTLRDLYNRLEALMSRHPGLTVRTLWANESVPSSPEHPWFQVLQRATAEVLGTTLPFRCSHGFTDARFFRDKGIPAAAIGIRGANTGGPDEYIEIDSLFKTMELFSVASWDYLTRFSWH